MTMAKGVAWWEHTARGLNPVRGILTDEGTLERGKRKGKSTWGVGPASTEGLMGSGTSCSHFPRPALLSVLCL